MRLAIASTVSTEVSSLIFKLVVQCRFVQLIFRQPMKLGRIHSSQSGASVPQHLRCGTAGSRGGFPGCITPICFVHPEALILFVRQRLQTLKELLGQPRPGPRIKLKHFRFDVIDGS